MSAISKSNLHSFIARKKNGKTNQTIKAKPTTVAFSHAPEEIHLACFSAQKLGLSASSGLKAKPKFHQASNKTKR